MIGWCGVELLIERIPFAEPGRLLQGMIGAGDIPRETDLVGRNDPFFSSGRIGSSMTDASREGARDSL
jgi:hypothetical protein